MQLAVDHGPWHNVLTVERTRSSDIAPDRIKITIKSPSMIGITIAFTRINKLFDVIEIRVVKKLLHSLTPPGWKRPSPACALFTSIRII